MVAYYQNLMIIQMRAQKQKRAMLVYSLNKKLLNFIPFDIVVLKNAKKFLVRQSKTVSKL